MSVSTAAAPSSRPAVTASTRSPCTSTAAVATSAVRDGGLRRLVEALRSRAEGEGVAGRRSGAPAASAAARVRAQPERAPGPGRERSTTASARRAPGRGRRRLPGSGGGSGAAGGGSDTDGPQVVAGAGSGAAPVSGAAQPAGSALTGSAAGAHRARARAPAARMVRPSRSTGAPPPGRPDAEVAPGSTSTGSRRVDGAELDRLERLGARHRLRLGGGHRL